LHPQNQRTQLFLFCTPTATTETYTLSLHDALPISIHIRPLHHDPERLGVFACLDADFSKERIAVQGQVDTTVVEPRREPERRPEDRKSTRLNSSHDQISYAVFCLKKKTRIVSPRII